MGELIEKIREKGLLLEREIFELVNLFHNEAKAAEFLEQIERVSGQKFITKSVLHKNVEYVKSFVRNLGEDKEVIEKVIISLGANLEIRRKVEESESTKNKSQNYKIFYANTAPDKKLEVSDFVGHFRSRFQQIQRILMSRAELQKNLVSIGKLSSDRSSFSLIGIVSEKSVTKNKNLIVTLEDLTGRAKVLFKADNTELLAKAEELQLDDIVGIRASGNRDIVFAYELFYPDSFVHEKVKFDEDFNVVFISDIHCGSDRHLGKSFSKFLRWVNSEDPFAKKIKYIFIVGDTVDGVGIFPGQEDFLELKSMQEQYTLLVHYLKQIPKQITIFMCPGQHDAVRVAEPQPIIGKRYASELYTMENLVLVTNPALVKLCEGEKEFKILMYHGASIHTLINEIKELREMKAHTCPAKAVGHMLKRRHLAPTHSEVVYIPNAQLDPLVISEVPDVLCTGEVHRLDIENYNGVLIITGSCWQAQTSFEEKIGNIPDPAKVPVLNMKTRELKVYNFIDDNEVENASK